MCGKPKKGVPHHWNQVFSELTKVLKMGSAGRKELFDTLTRLSARDGTYMIFGESVLGKLAMTFLMAMVPVVELRGAIPLPGTGAWTGALVADVLDLRMRVALPAIAAGVVIAGCITTAVTCGVAGLM